MLLAVSSKKLRRFVRVGRHRAEKNKIAIRALEANAKIAAHFRRVSALGIALESVSACWTIDRFNFWR